ncbi:hypothetical protein [Streptantibioticus silvisoli]|uniref:Uncharacterized protein n=1 Tax=Streptantibioticus silvisoli TaxID=2705255 RepID=A0ABT6W6U5_9ACTN|nr:hypothetical protein [Streptantibioticus silvisoli]MDI5966115.1 hypothetical protein [Streptantibioticus silvisoli]
MSADNPNLKTFRAAWKAAVRAWGAPRSADKEYHDWQYLCSQNNSLCGPLLATLGMYGFEANPDVFKCNAVSIGATGGVRSFQDLQSLRGISREDFKTLAEDAGYVRSDASKFATGGEGNPNPNSGYDGSYSPKIAAALEGALGAFDPTREGLGDGAAGVAP